MFKHRRIYSFLCATGAMLALLAPMPRAQAVQIQDIVRLKGSETNKIVGMGLVVGLRGTGDGGDFLPAMRALGQVIGRLNDEGVMAAELAFYARVFGIPLAQGIELEIDNLPPLVSPSRAPGSG